MQARKLILHVPGQSSVQVNSKTAIGAFYDRHVLTQTRTGLCWGGPAATVYYRPVLSLERALQNNKSATV
jgi:hypothetical protein